MKRPTKLTRRQKEIVNANGLMATEWMLVSESDSYLRIIKKDSIDTEFPKYKSVDKYAKKRR